MECVFCYQKFKHKDTHALERHYWRHTQERPYLCPKCPKELITSTGFDMHLETHKPLKERGMECNLCGKVFLTKQFYKLHIKYHDGGETFECKTCRKNFINPQRLLEHQYLHKNWTAFVCNICYKAFNYRQGLKKHYAWAHKGILHKCHICRRKFTTRGYLKYHLKQHDPRRRCFKCDKCPKSFRTKRGYEEHRYIHQDIEYSFECDKCDKRFLTSIQLKSHKRHSHLEARNVFTCVFCEKQFPQISALETHLASHTHERPHFCRRCPAEFRESSKRSTHNTTIHCKQRKQFNCEMCPKSFLTNGALENHIRHHMGELNFKCTSHGCGMRFVSENRQKRHFLKAHVGKQFFCTVCKKKFLTKPELSGHAVIHTNFSGYQCDRCESSFNQRSNLRRHKRTVHAYE